MAQNDGSISTGSIVDKAVTSGKLADAVNTAISAAASAASSAIATADAASVTATDAQSTANAAIPKANNTNDTSPPTLGADVVTLDFANSTYQPIGSGTIDDGTVGAAVLTYPEQFVSHDLIVIGADTYDFEVAGGTVIDDSYIGVVIGIDRAASIVNFMAAINATAGVTGLHLSGGGAALNHGTVAVSAADLGSSVGMALRNATVAGGPLTVGTKSVVLSTTLDPASSNNLWSQANLNSTGGAPTDATSTFRILITAPMVATTTTSTILYTPFSVLTGIEFNVYSANPANSAAYKIEGSSMQVTLDAAGLVQFQFGFGATPLAADMFVAGTIWGT